MDRLIRSEVQMASRLAHNQEIVSSILTAATISGPLRGPTARRLSHKEETVGRHHPERFSFRAQSIGETVHPTLNRRGPGATPGEPMFYCRAQHFSGLAEQQRHLFCKQAQTGAAPVAG
jgi:hypothetical protein